MKRAGGDSSEGRSKKARELGVKRDRRLFTGTQDSHTTIIPALRFALSVSQ